MYHTSKAAMDRDAASDLTATTASGAGQIRQGCEFEGRNEKRRERRRGLCVLSGLASDNSAAPDLSALRNSDTILPPHYDTPAHPTGSFSYSSTSYDHDLH